MGCSQIVHYLPKVYAAHMALEAYIGRKAKDQKLPYGSVMGAICYYLILPVLVFTATLIFSRKPKEGKK